MTNFPLFYAANMVAVSHSNMAAVFNKKSLLWGPQNSLIIFMLKIVKGNIINALSTYLGSLLVWFDYKPRASVSLSKMAVNWVQNQLITNNELLDPVLFFRSVTSLLSPPMHPQSSRSSCMACNAKRNSVQVRTVFIYHQHRQLNSTPFGFDVVFVQLGRLLAWNI